MSYLEVLVSHIRIFKTTDWLELTNWTELKSDSEVGAIRIIVIVVTDGSRVVITEHD